LKTKIKYLLFLLLIVGYTPFNQLIAQGKILTIEDAVMNRNLQPEQTKHLDFLPSGHYFVYSGQVKNESKLYIVTIIDQKVDSSITLTHFNKAVKEAGLTALNSLPAFKWLEDRKVVVNFGKKWYAYHRELNKLELIAALPDEAANIEWTNDYSKAAYTLSGNLYVRHKEKADAVQLTTDGKYGIVYGEAAHRHEFGINKGLFWSESGNYLAFYRIDETMVTDYPIVNNKDLPATTKMIKYPFAGSFSHHVTVGVYNTFSQSVHFLKTGSPSDQYLTNIAWSPDDLYIYLAKVSRNQKNMWLESYWVIDGNLDIILFDETNQKYVEPENPVVFLPHNPENFIWQSERDGFNHLYLYNTNGKMLKQLTKGPWVVTELIGFNTEQNLVYFMGTMDSPLERHLYAVHTGTGKIRKLTAEAGTHKVIQNKQGTFFLDKYQSLTIPGRTELLSESGALLKRILDAPNPLNEYELGETSVFPVQNGKQILYSRVIKPANFDPTKRYPVIVYVYGGPRVQMVNNTWLGGSNLWMQFLAQQGFIVFTLDNRGSSNRGFEFESAIYGKFGTLEMEDQLAGVEWLKKQPWVDASRIGLHGWSYGGFMTTSLMSRAPGVFKVGVAGGPVIDWSMYEIMYTERYMGTPESNKRGYEESNLLKYVDMLDGKLLMIHGTDDDVVLWQHSLLYVRKAIDAGKTNLDYFIYPEHKHNVFGKDRVHLMTKITEYLFENL
jgi:dipeptidyl-peptidase 4